MPARTDPSKATLVVEIEGVDLPGRRCDANPAGDPYEDIHVGLARRSETIELVPGDADLARWTIEVAVRHRGDGSFDFGGPFVLGQRGDRHLALRWGTLEPDGTFTVFRGAKLRFSDVPSSLVAEALASGGRLVARLGLTDQKGHPVCASVRPPDVVWSTSTTDRRPSTHGGGLC
jgi:hypothetical protein